MDTETKHKILCTLQARQRRAVKPVLFQMTADDSDTPDDDEGRQFINADHEDIRARYAFLGGSVGVSDWNNAGQVTAARKIADDTTPSADLMMTMYPGRRMVESVWHGYGAALEHRVNEYAKMAEYHPQWLVADTFFINFEEVHNANDDPEVRDTVHRFLTEIVAALRLNARGCRVLVYNEGAHRALKHPYPRLPHHGVYGDDDCFMGYTMETGIFHALSGLGTQRRNAWAKLWMEAGYRMGNFWNHSSKKQRHNGERRAWDHEHALRFFNDVGRLIGCNPMIPGVLLHRPQMARVDFAQRFLALLDGLDEGYAMVESAA